MQTIRASVDLPRINKQFDWKVSAMITTPSQNPAKWKDFTAYNRKTSLGTIQHNFIPRVFLSIQILEFGHMRGTNYQDRWFTLDPKGVYRFKMGLQKMYSGFQTKDLYFYDNDVLKLNQELSQQMMTTILAGDKTLRVAYATIKDEEHGTGDFEGIAVFVNNYNICMTLTHFELGFLLNELNTLNLTQVGFDLIRSAMHT